MSKYENINYDQFKELSDEQKEEALKILMERFPEKSQLAEYLGIRGNVLGILISKYILKNRLGRQKTEVKDEVIEPIKEKIPEQKPIEEVKTIEYTPLQLVTPTQSAKINELKNENDEGFNVNLNKQIAGEEAISRITKIANSLLEHKRYNINIIIQELDT